MNSFYRTYGLIGVLRLVLFKIRTFFIAPQARLIRFPIEIRNRKNIRIGKSLTTGFRCRIEAYPENTEEVCLQLGDFIEMNDDVHITARKKVVIGNHVLMASKIYISDCAHGNYSGDIEHDSPEVPTSQRALTANDVIIEDNVWIGEFVSILPGVKIGKGSIIGTMSVVTKSIPPYCIAVGSPAKVIKRYNFNTKRWEKE